MDARTVAVEGYRGMLKGKTVVIPGFRNSLVARTVGMMPRRMVTKVVRGIQEKRNN
jgi:short-subunit dehydrogenase